MHCQSATICFFRIAIISVFLLSGCGARLQTFDELSMELSRSMQDDARGRCQKNHLDGADYFSCVKQTDDEFNRSREWREKNDRNKK